MADAAFLSSTKTSADYIAEGYWQDFLAKRAIAGGIAYESPLYACALDESMASLQRVDTLLSQVKRDILSSAHLDEAGLLADDSYRHLLLFLGFYAGRVLAKQWRGVAHWYSQSELRRRYPELSLTADDFYQEMAMVYGGFDTDKGSNQSTDATKLFFALEPIGLRLFGNIDRQFTAVQGDTVANGLYQAVLARLPTASEVEKSISTQAYKQIAIESSDVDSSLTDKEPLSSDLTNSANSITVTTAITAITEPLDKAPLDKEVSQKTTVVSRLQKQPAQTTAIDANNVNVNSINTIVTNDDAQTSVAKVKIEEGGPQATVTNSPKSNLVVHNKKSSPTPELFTRLLTELDEIEVLQSQGVEDYNLARKTLDQFERHIARQPKPRAQVSFSETHQTARLQALILLQSAAKAGNTAAMLRLAMYELLGESQSTSLNSSSTNNESVELEIEKATTEKSAGVAWVQQAADKCDSRAQRLLSRLYYQGVGVSQDMDTGKYWLEQAASNGHPEAIAINKEWQQAQALIDTQKQEQHSFKRYQLLIGVILILAIALIIFV